MQKIYHNYYKKDINMFFFYFFKLRNKYDVTVTFSRANKEIHGWIEKQ